MAKRKEVITKSEMVAIQNSVTNEMEFAKVSIRVEKDMPKYKNEAFTIVFQAVNSLLVKEMSLVDCKVLLYLISRVQYGNLIDRTIKEIAEDLGYKDSQWIQKSLKSLEKTKVILKSQHPQDKRRYVYMLNPKQSWKGTVKDRQKTISLLNPDQLQMNFDNNVELKESKHQALPNNFDFLTEDIVEMK